MSGYSIASAAAAGTSAQALYYDGSGYVALAGGAMNADALVAATEKGPDFRGFGFLFNGTTWDRQRSATGANGGTTGSAATTPMVWDGSGYNRLNSPSNIGDAGNGQNSASVGALLYNGASYDRMRGASAAALTEATSVGAQVVVPLSTWSVTHTPAVNTQATASKAAGGGTVRHVCTGLSFSIASATATANLLVHLRDGATGAGTILCSWAIIIANNVSRSVDLSGLSIHGSQNTAMTLEFSAIGGTVTSQEIVNMFGFSLPT